MRMTQCDPFKCILTYAIFMRWIQIPSAHLHLNMNGAFLFREEFKRNLGRLSEFSSLKENGFHI